MRVFSNSNIFSKKLCAYIHLMHTLMFTREWHLFRQRPRSACYISSAYCFTISIRMVQPLKLLYSDIGNTIPRRQYLFRPNVCRFCRQRFHLQFGLSLYQHRRPDSPLDPDSTRADMGARFLWFRTDIDEPLPLPEQFILHQKLPQSFQCHNQYKLPVA